MSRLLVVILAYDRHFKKNETLIGRLDVAVSLDILNQLVSQRHDWYS